jgi:hypothetical protein
VVVDISEGGARLSVAAAAAMVAGQAVTLLVSGLGHFRGTVAWSEAGSVGLRFGA